MKNRFLNFFDSIHLEWLFILLKINQFQLSLYKIGDVWRKHQPFKVGKWYFVHPTRRGITGFFDFFIDAYLFNVLHLQRMFDYSGSCEGCGSVVKMKSVITPGIFGEDATGIYYTLSIPFLCKGCGSIIKVAKIYKTLEVSSGFISIQPERK